MRKATTPSDPAALPRRWLHRQGVQDECLRSALQSFPPADPDTLWISTSPRVPAALPAKKAHTVLGQEYSVIVFDAFSGLDVNAFAAVSGTLRGGGLFVLLSPPLADWPDFPDPDYRRFLPYPHVPEQVEGRFLRRWVVCVRNFASDYPPSLTRPAAPSPRFAPPQGGEGISIPVRNRSVRGALSACEASLHQSSVIRDIITATVPIVLTADRGRGKSAALGMAASEWLAAGQQVLLTAPSRAAVGSVFKHASQPLAFFAPDDLLQTLPPADVLMVDEAAAIPLPLLVKMQSHYPRCVFSTTLHGYEGSGRGFVLRFQQVLDEVAPGWQALRLHHPMRWAGNDPLERAINRWLLLDVSLQDVPAVQCKPDEAEYRCLDRHALSMDEPLLRQLFGLLVTAHYQTRPSDLRQMLDAPDLSIHVLEQGGCVLAVVLLSREGRLDAELTAAIQAGKRRPHGHPVPQTLTFHAGISGAAQLRCERIMRIAVHPALQGGGLGMRLLSEVQCYAEANQADYLGVSYALTPALSRFWERAGFVLARIGHRKDTASGSRSAVQVKGLTAAGKALQIQCEVQFTTPV